MTLPDALQTAFAETGGTELSLAADGIPTVRVPLAQLLPTIERVRGELGHRRFVDLTAVDRLSREGRFELVYLFYSLEQRTWLRLKTRTDGEAPSITPLIPGANWYERELFDLFGVRFDGHPDLKRILTPDDWDVHVLRKDYQPPPEPIEFSFNPEQWQKAAQRGDG
jgi:NADH:ubiquinone oxidoreductase subunit C